MFPGDSRYQEWGEKPSLQNYRVYQVTSANVIGYHIGMDNFLSCQLTTPACILLPLILKIKFDWRNGTLAMLTGKNEPESTGEMCVHEFDPIPDLAYQPWCVTSHWPVLYWSRSFALIRLDIMLSLPNMHIFMINTLLCNPRMILVRSDPGFINIFSHSEVIWVSPSRWPVHDCKRVSARRQRSVLFPSNRLQLIGTETETTDSGEVFLQMEGELSRLITCWFPSASKPYSYTLNAQRG